MAQNIALQVRTPQPDLAAITNAAQKANLNDYQLRNAPMKSELESLQLQDEIGGQKAMAGYRDAVGRGDPNAIKQLDSRPEMQAQMYAAFDGMSPQEFMEAKKRSTAFKNAAQHVLSMPKERQPEAWHASIQVLKEKGFIDDRQFRMMEESGPSDLIIQQALTANEWTQQYLAEKAKKKDPFTLGAGQVRFDADGNQIASGPPKDSVANKPPAGYRPKDDGSLEPIPGGPADPRVKASQGAGGVTTKMHNDAVAVDQAYNNLNTALEDYGALIERTGVSAIPGEDNDAIKQSRTNLQLQLKELYNLGVLNGPDLSLMQQMIFDPQVSAFNPVDAAAKLYGETGLPGSGSVNVGNRAKTSIVRVKEMLKTIRDNKTKGILDENGNFVGKGGAAAFPGADQETGEAPVDLSQEDVDMLLQQAIEAVDQGEDRAAVLGELIERGVDAGLAAESLGQ